MSLMKIFLIGLCSVFIFYSYAQAENDTALIPIEAFADLPSVSKVRLSPSGDKVVSLVRYKSDEKQGVAAQVYDLNTQEKRVLTHTDNSKYRIYDLQWANNDEVFIYLNYSGRVFRRLKTTKTRLLKADANTGEVSAVIPLRLLRKLDFIPTFQTGIVDYLPEEPDSIIMSLRTKTAVGTEVYKINHQKGRYKKIHNWKAHGYSWYTDRQHRLRINTYFNETTHRVSYRTAEGTEWKELQEFESFSEQKLYPLGFDHDPDQFYYLANHQGRLAVFRRNLQDINIEPELIHSHSNYDIEGRLVYSKSQKKVVGIEHSLSGNYFFWDHQYKVIKNTLNHVLPDTDNTIVGMSDDERRVVIFAQSDIDPGTYYFWDRDKGAMDAFALKYSSLEVEDMAEKKHVKYAARDGQIISGYLTRPKGTSNKAGPTIIFPHGGPISRTGSGFDYWTQFFASRGYTVLQMNFRGSSGYGYDFMKAGVSDWGGKMQTDVEDGTRWLIKEGIADADKICVVGASYGGFAALMEVANNNELYQCVASFAGVTDLTTLLNQYRNFTNYKSVKEMIGGDSKSRRSKSPVNRIEEIKVPVLLAHGTDDRRVDIRHGRKMSTRLKKANKEVNYLEFDKGDHFLSAAEDRIQWFTALDEFLAEHIGG